MKIKIINNKLFFKDEDYRYLQGCYNDFSNTESKLDYLKRKFNYQS